MAGMREAAQRSTKYRFTVMAELGAGQPILEDVNARHKAGHDEEKTKRL